MTELRTMWGLKISDFGTEISESLKERSQRFIAGDYVELNEEVMLLTDKGKLIADRIVLELMMEEE
jgi:coproporphyrinogen III oxidase-like Fe-S oxidoreductase